MSLKEVFIGELRDMYSAENQLVKALPRLAKHANNGDLSDLVEAHLAETKGHVARLQTVFDLLDEKPTGEHCSGMEGAIEESSNALGKDTEDASFDAGLLGAALRIEHYEIAGYEVCVSMAKALQLPDVVMLLTSNLDEEVTALRKIKNLAPEILEEAAKEPDQDSDRRTRKEKLSNKRSKEDEAKAASAMDRDA